MTTYNYVIDWSRGRYGHNARLWRSGKRLFVAGGGGYCKETACAEEAIKDATGKYVSLGGFEYADSVNESMGTAGINAVYSVVRGRNESLITIKVED